MPTSVGSSKKQESFRKTSISALLTMPKPLTVWITINCGKFLKKWDYQTTLPASWEICMQVKEQRGQRRRQWEPTPVLLPGKSHGWRSLVGCSPWSHEESDTTEQLHFHFSLSFIGEGNGNRLQYSCLENPRDGSVVGCHLWGHIESDMTEVT